MSFVHLHSHSFYSLLDGLGSPEAMVKRAKELGSPALGLTDHGVMYGAIEFYKACQTHEIKPIIGCEMYVATRTRFDREPQLDQKPYHLTVLAKDYEGYKNLMLLTTKAHLEGFYYKPRVDHGLLKAHAKGLIALSGCIVSETSRAILDGKLDKALEIVGRYQEIFGRENFYLELQDHPLIEEQAIVNEGIIELAKRAGAKLVATNDAHYVHADDAEAHDILLCIQTQVTVQTEHRMRYTGDFSLRTYESMEQAFRDVPEALSNTLAIAEQCHLEIPFHQNLLPGFKTPNGENNASFLRALAEEGFSKKYQSPPNEEAKKRLEYELKVVHQMGFDTYFLIVHDVIKFARDRGIVVGPGRGSAAGSILAYSLGITELDPLKHGLIFERFLNPERVSMPDIDMDFADDRRAEVLDYVIQKYGRENVAQIVTFGTMAARAAIRDTGRVLGYPYPEVDRIAKMVPPPILGKHRPLKKSLESDPELRGTYDTDARAKKLLDLAVKLEGTVRQAGTHACAVVISEKPLEEFTPLQHPVGQNENDLITQYSMKPIDEIGLLKMDFLGLKNLTILEKTVKLIEQLHKKTVDCTNLPMDDEKTFQLLQRGETVGVFQLESDGMRRYLKELKPTRFEDIVAMVSLYRPGPMEWIPLYIKGKRNLESVAYFHKSLEPILKETYGVAVYQEQILQIAQAFSGFSLGEADILRKAVGKKIPELLKEQEEKFVSGAKKKGHTEKFAREVFKKVIEPFAGYGFNKAHAACYAMIAYRTAYLKANFPTEFMAALLTCDLENTDRIVLEIQECASMEIAVLPPSINESYTQFTVVDKEKIRFGLGAIKGLGDGTAKVLNEVRAKTGTFKSLEDMLERVPYETFNKKMFESLAFSGALDELGDRRMLAENYENVIAYAKAIQKSHEAVGSEQTDIFDLLGEHAVEKAPLKMKKVPTSTPLEQLKWEKQFLGLYVSQHPLDGLRKYLEKKVFLLEKLAKKDLGRSLKIGGLLTRVKKITTRQGATMMQAVLSDPTAKVEIVIFPKVFGQYSSVLREDQMVILQGKLDRRRGTLQFSADSVQAISLESMIESAKKESLYDETVQAARNAPMLTFGDDDAKPEKTWKDPEFAEEPYTYEEPEAPYIITVSNGLNTETLSAVKSLLTSHKGDRPVEIHIRNQHSVKRIRVPFGVKVDEALEEKLQHLLMSAH